MLSLDNPTENLPSTFTKDELESGAAILFVFGKLTMRICFRAKQNLQKYNLSPPLNFPFFKKNCLGG